jgi:hypothetical protein
MGTTNLSKATIRHTITMLREQFEDHMQGAARAAYGIGNIQGMCPHEWQSYFLPKEAKPDESLSGELYRCVICSGITRDMNGPLLPLGLDNILRRSA